MPEQESRKTLEEQIALLREWVNLGGAPSGKICGSDPNDQHFIYGGGVTINGVDLCDLHHAKMLEERIAALEAFRHRVHERVADDKEYQHVDDDLLLARIDDLDNVEEAERLMKRNMALEERLAVLEAALKNIRALPFTAENGQAVAWEIADSALFNSPTFLEGIKREARIAALREAWEFVTKAWDIGGPEGAEKASDALDELKRMADEEARR